MTLRISRLIGSLALVLAITSCQIPDEALPLERIDILVDGKPGFLIQPTTHTSKWVWFTPTLLSAGLPGATQNWIFSKLVQNGIAVAGIDVGESYGSPDGIKIFDNFYHLLVSQYGMSPKPCLFPQSRGGLMSYGWAEQNP